MHSHLHRLLNQFLVAHRRHHHHPKPKSIEIVKIISSDNGITIANNDNELQQEKIINFLL
jgi:hypothetical protein